MEGIPPLRHHEALIESQRRSISDRLLALDSRNDAADDAGAQLHVLSFDQQVHVASAERPEAPRPFHQCAARGEIDDNDLTPGTNLGSGRQVAASEGHTTVYAAFSGHRSPISLVKVYMQAGVCDR